VSAEAGTEVYVFAGFSLDHRRRLLFGPDGQPVHLSPRAFDTLQYLVEHPNQLVDKRTLMKAVWPNAVVEENNLNQHISAVRRALGEAHGEHRFVVTVQGRGFQFVAPVTAAVAPASPVVQSRTKKMPWAFGAMGLVLAAALSWYVTHLHARPANPAVRASATPSAEVAPVREPRLAVLPFENLSPDPGNALYADGLNEEMASTIAQRVPGIEVISRANMMSYRADAPKPLAVVARELGASHLMEGSVRREANRIRLTLQLIDARTDEPVWSASYDRTVADAATLESQVADEVARQLSARLTGPP
jgi:TolB-like protein/DNA-binding winged helix-turn-helix (wHTH) protein